MFFCHMESQGEVTPDLARLSNPRQKIMNSYEWLKVGFMVS